MNKPFTTKQRQMYMHALHNIESLQDEQQRTAFRRGKDGHPNTYHPSSLVYACWAAGRDKRDGK